MRRRVVAESVRREARALGREAVLAAGHAEEHERGDRRRDDLRDDVGDYIPPRKAPRYGEPDSHGWIEMPARHRADRIDHHHHGDAESERDAEEVDAVIAGVEDRSAAPDEHEDERAEELGTEPASE